MADVWLGLVPAPPATGDHMRTATTTTRASTTTANTSAPACPGAPLALSGPTPGAKICCSFMSPRAYPHEGEIEDDQHHGVGSAHSFRPCQRAEREEGRRDQPRELQLSQRRDRRERDEQRRHDQAESEIDRVAVERLTDQRRAAVRHPEANRGERVRDARERTQDQHAKHRVRDMPVACEAQRGLHHARAAADDQSNVDEDQP